MICELLDNIKLSNEDKSITSESNYELFKSILLPLTISKDNQPPLFTINQSEEIIDYMVLSVYQHFLLYQSIFTIEQPVKKQELNIEIETPIFIQPLNDFQMIAENQVINHSIENLSEEVREKLISEGTISNQELSKPSHITISQSKTSVTYSETTEATETTETTNTTSTTTITTTEPSTSNVGSSTTLNTSTVNASTSKESN